MSVATPTLIPRAQIFPLLLPRPPEPYPTPLPKCRPASGGRLNTRRDLVKEMADLSDEDNELDEQTINVQRRGFSFLIPIGKNLTQQEEKNDIEDVSDESQSAHSGAPASVIDDADGENESQQDLEQQDLDASIEDMDAEEDETADDIDPEEYEEGQSGDI